MADEPNLDSTTQTVEGSLTAAPAETRKRRSPPKRDEAAAPVAKKAANAATAIAASKSRRHSESEKAEKLAEIERRLREGSTLKAASEAAGISDQTFYQWKRSAPSANVTVSAPQKDSLADLVEIEAENLRLRGLLAQKLRAENTELRKRLGLS